MNTFDKHIRDKMTRMEVNPSREVSERIKSTKPRPYFKHLFKRYGYWFAAGIAVIGILSLVVFDHLFVNNRSNDNTISQSQEQLDNHTQNISSLNNNSDNPEQDSKAVVTVDAHKNDIRHTEHKEIHSYKNNIVLTSDTKGSWLCKSNADIITTNYNECVIHCPDYGNYKMLWFNDNGDTVYYHIEYMEMPQIFSSKDTTVKGLKCRISCNTNDGNWQVPEGIELTALSDKNIIISANKPGHYMVIRTEKDSIGRYSDTISVHFIDSQNKYKVVLRPVCPGESAVIVVDKGFVPVAEEMNCIKSGEDTFRLTFMPSASELAICSIIDEKTGNKIESIKFNIPKKVELNYETHPKTCKNNGTVFVKDNPDIVEIYLDDNNKVEVGKHIDLEAGNYTLTWKDTRGCIDSSEITINQADILNADFELEISLDGFSARTTNLTNYADQTYSDNLYYEWYVNGNLQSTAKEPELQLDELINSVKLYVTDGKLCSDSMIKKDIIPDQSPIRVPNFFTPNNDGYFDQFKVLIDSRLTDFKAIITSRSGQTVYEWSDPSKGWDGKIFGNENASEGVYFYIIQAYDSTGLAIEKRGTLQLIR
ncbi:MAG: gliding motility-associated C-terminal domain-containing protein [Bacteroidales bacterium]